MNERQTEGVISKRFYKLLDTLLIQSQVFQSSLWNTISPQRSKSSIESHSKDANPGYGFPLDSDGQPDIQRYRGKEARTDQNIHSSKRGLLHRDRNGGKVTSNDRPQQRHRDNTTKSTALSQSTSISSSTPGCVDSGPYSGRKCLKVNWKTMKTCGTENLLMNFSVIF